MNTHELKKKLQEDDIDITSFDQLLRQSKQKYPKFYDYTLTPKKYFGAIEALRYFESLFSKEEFGKLVCAKLISYMRIHAFYLSTTSSHKELNVKTFATPKLDDLTHLEVSCSINGEVKVSRQASRNPELVSF